MSNPGPFEPVHVEGWMLQRDGETYWIKDLDLAERAELAKPRDIRSTIEGCIEDRLIFEARIGAAAAGANETPTNVGNPHACGSKSTGKIGAAAAGADLPALYRTVEEVVVSGKGRRQPVIVYYLNREAALHVIMRLRTPKAIALQIAVVRVFFLAMDGVLSAPAAPPKLPETNACGPVRFPFDGDELDLVLDSDGAHLVLQTVCTVLGLSFLDELAVARTDPALRVVTKSVQLRGDARARPVACLDVRSVPLWLGQVHASKLDPRTRSKLTRYKQGFGEALLDYFHGKRGAASDDHRMLYLHDALRAKWQADNATMLGHIHREVSETDRAKIDPLRKMTVDLALRVQEVERGHLTRMIQIEPPKPQPPRTGPGRRPMDKDLGARKYVISGKLTEYRYAGFRALCAQNHTDGSGMLNLLVTAGMNGMVVLPATPEPAALPAPKGKKRVKAKAKRRGQSTPRPRAGRELAKRMREQPKVAHEPKGRKKDTSGARRRRGGA